jgi:hypothetical protein
MIGGQLASVQTARMAVPHLRPVIALALARRAVVGRLSSSVIGADWHSLHLKGDCHGRDYRSQWGACALE